MSDAANQTPPMIVDIAKQGDAYFIFVDGEEYMVDDNAHYNAILFLRTLQRLRKQAARARRDIEINNFT